MVHLATEDFPKLQPSDIEFKLSQPNYTVNTLVHLEENPIMNFHYGEDNLKSLYKWKKLRSHFAKSRHHVYPRISSEPEN
jgi:nicotinate-nucleotide adenylyltransferase